MEPKHDPSDDKAQIEENLLAEKFLVSVNYSFQASQENKPSEEETLEANETYVAREIAPRYMYSGSNVRR
uniref:Uncharacterized protein n=1 Tax=Rhizophagus irregularis (strain DAOM 181602 / DAOM 197198 / MUCL 43194) TaxID=747089 RepID=U9UAZ2_RHIID